MQVAQVYRNTDLDETGVVVKAAAGVLLGWQITNAAAALRYVKVYNKATAATNADTPVLTIGLLASSSQGVQLAMPIVLSAGISLRATTGVADNDVGAPAANDVLVHFLYQ